MDRRRIGWRLLAATVVLLLSAGWYWRPINRSLLLPVPLASRRYVYVNGQGRVAFANRWDFAGEFNDRGFARVDTDSRSEWIDRTGNVVGSDDDMKALIANQAREEHSVIPFSSLNPLGDGAGYYRIQEKIKAGPWGEVDGQERLFILPHWEGVAPEVTLARVLRRDRWGYMDRDNQWVLPPQWVSASDFAADGLARVESRNKTGFIDQSGKTVIPLDWDTAEDFDPVGLALVSQRGKFGFIDRSGQIIVPLTWDSTEGFKGNSLAPVRRNKLWGCINRKGKESIECQWSEVRRIQDRGQVFYLFGRKDEYGPPWVERIKIWYSNRFQRELIPRQTWALFDSNGTCLWSSAWLMSSWAPAIMAIAGLWLMIDLWRWKRSYRTPAGSSLSSLNHSSD